MSCCPVPKYYQKSIFSSTDIHCQECGKKHESLSRLVAGTYAWGKRDGKEEVKKAFKELMNIYD